jgi:hypothetical protein
LNSFLGVGETVNGFANHQELTKSIDILTNLAVGLVSGWIGQWLDWSVKKW